MTRQFKLVSMTRNLREDPERVKVVWLSMNKNLRTALNVTLSFMITCSLVSAANRVWLSDDRMSTNNAAASILLVATCGGGWQGNKSRMQQTRGSGTHQLQSVSTCAWKTHQPVADRLAKHQRNDLGVVEVGCACVSRYDMIRRGHGLRGQAALPQPRTIAARRTIAAPHPTRRSRHTLCGQK